MVLHNSLASGGTLTAQRWLLHRAHRSIVKEGLQSSVFDGICPYGTGQMGDLILLTMRQAAVAAGDDGAIWVELGSDEGSFQGSSGSRDFSCSGREAWGSSSVGQLGGESGAIMGR
jgi:hypothetical protein